MTILSPFQPTYGSNIAVAPAAASASSTIGKSNKSLRVVNTGANPGYFRTGFSDDGAVAATAADVLVPAGESIIIGKPQDHDTVAYISGAGTTFEIMAGEGGI